MNCQGTLRFVALLAVGLLLLSAVLSGCRSTDARARHAGEYQLDYEATLRALEGESGPLSEEERDRLSVNVAIRAPWVVTLNADGSFAWDNAPKRHNPLGPDGVAYGGPLIAWTGGSGTYEIRNEGQLSLDYEKVSEGIEAAVGGWYGEEWSPRDYEARRGEDDPPLDVTTFGECTVHHIRGQFIRWRYGRDCQRFLLLRRR